MAIYAFLNAWNEFLAALIIMTQESKFTLPILLTSVRSGSYGAIDWGSTPGRRDRHDLALHRDLLILGLPQPFMGGL